MVRLTSSDSPAQYIQVHDEDIQSLAAIQQINGVLNSRSTSERLPSICESDQVDAESQINPKLSGASNDHINVSNFMDKTNVGIMNGEPNSTNTSAPRSCDDPDSGIERCTTSGSSTDRSGSHSPCSTSLILPENCEDTGVLLYRHDDQHNVASKSPKECYDKIRDTLVDRLRHNSTEHVVSRSRHNSKDQPYVDPLIRVRHASYDGPASQKISSCDQDLLELGEFPHKVETNSNGSSSSSEELKTEHDEHCWETFMSVCAVSILLFANTLNYMDRYVVAGNIYVYIVAHTFYVNVCDTMLFSCHVRLSSVYQFVDP